MPNVGVQEQQKWKCWSVQLIGRVLKEKVKIGKTKGEKAKNWKKVGKQSEKM